MKLYLYGTSACHLCEKAHALVYSLADEYDLKIVEIDISEDDELLELYGTTIPVLLHINTQQSLNWPFDLQDTRQFLDGLASK